jgi:hypothetical protein
LLVFRDINNTECTFAKRFQRFEAACNESSGWGEDRSCDLRCGEPREEKHYSFYSVSSSTHETATSVKQEIGSIICIPIAASIDCFLVVFDMSSQVCGQSTTYTDADCRFASFEQWKAQMILVVSVHFLVKCPISVQPQFFAKCTIRRHNIEKLREKLLFVVPPADLHCSNADVCDSQPQSQMIIVKPNSPKVA